MNPIIVTGAPHSGTSVIARLLQTKMDVMMDEGPIRADEYKPLGYYEDHRVMEINNIAYYNHLDKLQKQEDKSLPIDIQVPPKWAIEFAKWLVYRNSKYKKWGWKDPVCGGLFQHMHQFFDNPIWIVCKRRDEDVLKSLIEKEKFPKAVAAKGLRAFQNLIAKQLDGKCNYIDMSEYVEEKELVKLIDKVIN